MDIDYESSGISIKLYYNFFKTPEIYLEHFSNESTKKKGQARGVLRDIIVWLVHSKHIKTTDTFGLHAQSPDKKTQKGLESMYEKMGFKQISNGNKPKYEQSVGNYLK